jgi:DNA modification methylase
MVCTSPPYWCLRDYGTAQWEGGSTACDHRPARTPQLHTDGKGYIGKCNSNWDDRHDAYRDVCGKCGARRIDAQIGLEPMIEEYVETLVAVFRLVRNVLADDGTLWLNLGDSYNSHQNNHNWLGGKGIGAESLRGRAAPGLKPKDLCGIPWRVALALQADGWYLRQDIIWSKPGPMPESVTDRCTRSHEYLFLLSKSSRYFFDSYAIKEQCSENTHGGKEPNQHKRWDIGLASQKTTLGISTPSTRNKRSVWTIAAEPFPGQHFATFPQKLVEPCILAGTSECGHCPGCGKRWVRVVEREFVPDHRRQDPAKASGNKGLDASNGWGDTPRGSIAATPRGWKPGCACGLEPVPDVVLDPFAGSNTVGLVAERLGRHWLGIELSEAYGELAKARTEGITQSIFL